MDWLRKTITRRGAIGLLVGSTLIPAATRYARAEEVNAAEPLRWPRPLFVDSTIIDINSKPGLQRIVLKMDKDYWVRIGPNTKGRIETTEIKLIGGRNIVIVGGHIVREGNTETNDPRTGERRTRAGVTLNILGHRGTAYVEGLLIDNAKQFGADGFNLGGADTGGLRESGDFVLQNIHIRGVNGTATAENKKPINHADGMQLWGPIRTLKINNMTICSNYQGLNVQPQSRIGMAELRRLNLRYPNPSNRSGQANGYALWLGSGRPFGEPANYILEDVFVEPRIAWNAPWLKTSIAPDASMPNGAKAVEGREDRAYWDRLGREDQRIAGYVTRGIPPKGDFCPASRIINDRGEVIYR